MIVPHDVNNNPVGRVRWYRSLDLVTSEELTAAADKYDFKDLHSSGLVLSGDFAGLYKDLYVLSIVNVSSSDNGYYWCQIINDQTCLLPSPYVNISVTTASNANGCSFGVDYENNSDCSNITNETCTFLSTAMSTAIEFYSLNINSNS